MAVYFKRLHFWMFLFFSFSALAQLENGKKTLVHKNTALSPEEKNIKALYALYNKGDEKKAYLKAHSLLKSSSSNRLIASADLLLAYYFNKRALVDSSLYYTRQALKFNTTVNDSLKNRLYGLSYNLMAINYKKRGLFEESKKWHIKGIEVSQKYNEKNLYYTHTHGLAKTYADLGDYKKALELFKKCLEYKEDEEIILGSCINIGDIYSDMKEYDNANSYYKKGKTLCEKTNNNQGRAVILLGLGANYQLQHKLDEALKMYQEAVVIADKGELNQIAVIARGNVADIYIDQKKYNEAKLIFSEGIQKAVQFGFLQDQVHFYDELQKIAVLQDDYKNAYNYLGKSNQIKDSINKLQKIKEINELEIKYNTSEKEKAIKQLEFENETKKLTLANQTEALKNMSLREEITKKINENTILFFQNSADKKRNEINLLKKDQQLKTLEISQQKKNRAFTILAFLIILIPIAGLSFQYRNRLKNQRLLNAKQIEISTQRINGILKDQELKLIKASISGQDKERERISQELHDSIGGNLAAIKLQLTNLNESNLSNVENLNSQLDETYQQVRNLAHNLIPKKFSNHKFCEVLESYLKNISEASRIKISFTTYPKAEINAMDETIQIETFKIVQELLTNTIKHAKASAVELQFNLIDNSLNILFEDNGVGFNTENYSRGIGFINLEARIAKLDGTFALDSKLKRGTIANIEIPILDHSNVKKNPVQGIQIKNQLIT
ncbi:Signal transduction histidine kinase [Flavobacterium resistens]|uniref:histidine kinase n=1 Tax=Flavobacterium resistens TaxID=443612 RepID=A0A521F4Y6_9FLAO|nr:sensor histidine kinase [Flavobacterium resistens]MRX69520.1 tetratricopeptide repeat protein [Flavobacterium resistens]SMO90711.1 Signal transduction histidine kinase [Flavobacterium resistens]